MTPSKLVKVFSNYKKRLVVPPAKLSDEQYDWRYLDGISSGDTHRHLVWMCDQAIGFVAEGRIEKAMRWLGFIQGALWCMGVKTLNALRDDSKPDGEGIEQDVKPTTTG